MNQSEKDTICNLLDNVSKANQHQNSASFENNKANFLYWLGKRLGNKREDFLKRLEPLPEIALDIYVFSYAIENPGHFARVLIEILES